MKLDANDEQLMYPTFYASAREGWAFKENPLEKKINLKDYKGDMNCLFDAIIEHVPPPKVDLSAPFKFLVNNLEANNYLGRCQMGRVETGSIKVGDPLKAMDEHGKVIGKAVLIDLTLGEGKVSKILIKRGLEQFSIPKAEAGDIVTIAGIPIANVNSTVCSPEVNEPIKVNYYSIE
jgi:GTP-binding protein